MQSSSVARVFMVNFNPFYIFLLFSEADRRDVVGGILKSKLLCSFFLLFVYGLRFFLSSVLHDKIFGIVLQTYYSICRRHCHTHLEIIIWSCFWTVFSSPIVSNCRVKRFSHSSWREVFIFIFSCYNDVISCPCKLIFSWVSKFTSESSSALKKTKALSVMWARPEVMFCFSWISWSVSFSVWVLEVFVLCMSIGPNNLFPNIVFSTIIVKFYFVQIQTCSTFPGIYSGNFFVVIMKLGHYIYAVQKNARRRMSAQQWIVCPPNSK